LAGDVWAAMVNAVMARKDRMAAVAGKFELTLPQAHLLRLLTFGPARTMTSIAEALACDASNVTGIVDRLETRGLITRGNAKHDRRIKTITLTAQGKEVLAQLTRGFLEPPEALRDLPEAQLRKLHSLVIRAFGQWTGEGRCSEAPADVKSQVRSSSKP
jgi:DNA-binding MarR family transcriptional regulator